jgi:hypothetical protein
MPKLSVIVLVACLQCCVLHDVQGNNLDFKNRYLNNNNNNSTHWVNKTVRSYDASTRRGANTPQVVNKGRGVTTVHLQVTHIPHRGRGKQPIIPTHPTSRVLLQSQDEGNTPSNSFRVGHVQQVGSRVVVRVSYTTGDNVVPIFMLPHRNVASLERLSSTFQKRSNPCLRNGGVTTLCCITHMFDSYQISKSYGDVREYMCPGGKSHTSATVSIPLFYHASMQNRGENEVDVFIRDIIPQPYTGEKTSWVQVGPRDREHGVNEVEFVLSDEFIAQHSIRLQNHNKIVVLRFFIGVTFTQLQKSNKIQNSAAMSVITLFRNITSSRTVASVVTQNGETSIQDVGAKLSMKTTDGVTYFFVDMHIRTHPVSGLPERNIDAESVRYVIGLDSPGVADDVSLSLGPDSWARPCDNKMVMSVLSNTSLDHLCVPVYTEDSMSVTIPVGVDILDPGILFDDNMLLVLHIQMETESSTVTAQIHLETPRIIQGGLQDMSPGNESTYDETRTLSETSFAYGIAPDGFRHTCNTQLVPIAYPLRNDSVAIMSVISNPMFATDVDDIDGVIGMNLDGITLDDLYVFQFLGPTLNDTISVTQKTIVAATAASNHLKQEILLGKLFYPDDHPSHALHPDFDMLNQLCDVSPASKAPCRWTNAVVNDEVSQQAQDSLFILDSSTPNSAPHSKSAELKLLLSSKTSEDPDIIDDFIDDRLDKIMFFYSSATFNDLDIPTETTSLFVICVALVSKNVDL